MARLPVAVHGASGMHVGSASAAAPLASARFFSSSPVEPEVASSAAAEVVEAVADDGWWGSVMSPTADSAADMNFITTAMQQPIEWLHTTAGLSYAASLVTFVVGVRLLLIPLALKSQKVMRLTVQHKPELEMVQTRHKEALARVSGDAVAKKDLTLKYQQAMAQHNKKHGIKLSHSMMFPFAMGGFSMSLFFALRNMPLTTPGWSAGGFSWCTDLLVHDPTFLIPISSMMFNLIGIELFGGEANNKSKVMRNFMRVFMPAVALMTSHFPAGIVLMWATNSGFSCVQSGLLSRKPVQEFLGLPAMPTPEEQAVTPQMKIAAKGPLELLQQAKEEAREQRKAVRREKRTDDA